VQKNEHTNTQRTTIRKMGNGTMHPRRIQKTKRRNKRITHNDGMLKMVKEWTTISIDKKTKERLYAFGKKGESNDKLMNKTPKKPKTTPEERTRT